MHADWFPLHPIVCILLCHQLSPGSNWHCIRAVLAKINVICVIICLLYRGQRTKVKIRTETPSRGLAQGFQTNSWQSHCALADMKKDEVTAMRTSGRSQSEFGLRHFRLASSLTGRSVYSARWEQTHVHVYKGILFLQDTLVGFPQLHVAISRDASLHPIHLYTFARERFMNSDLWFCIVLYRRKQKSMCYVIKARKEVCCPLSPAAQSGRPLQAGSLFWHTVQTALWVTSHRLYVHGIVFRTDGMAHWNLNVGYHTVFARRNPSGHIQWVFQPMNFTGFVLIIFPDFWISVNGCTCVAPVKCCHLLKIDCTFKRLCSSKRTMCTVKFEVFNDK